MKKLIIALMFILPVALLTGCVAETTYYNPGYTPVYRSNYVYSSGLGYYSGGLNTVGYGVGYGRGYYNRGYYNRGYYHGGRYNYNRGWHGGRSWHGGRGGHGRR